MKTFIRNELKIFLLVFIAACFGCQHNPPISQPTIEGIGVAAESKSKGEQWAGKAKKDFAVNTGEYQKVNALYIDAKAAFDGWIVQLKIGLTAGGNINDSDAYKNALQKASEKADAFFKYVTALYEKDVKIKATPAIIAAILPSLTDAGIKIWQEYTRAEEVRRKEIKKELDNLKWQSFEEIK